MVIDWKRKAMQIHGMSEVAKHAKTGFARINPLESGTYG